MITVYAALFGAVAFSVFYTNEISNRSERKFCDIITTINDAYRQYPEPSTDLGKQLRLKYAVLEEQLHCRE